MNCLINFTKKIIDFMELNTQFCGLLIAYEFSFHTFLLFSWRPLPTIGADFFLIEYRIMINEFRM